VKNNLPIRQNTCNFAIMKNTILLILLCLLTFVACRKYEDGPAFTVLSKTERVTNDWILDAVALQTPGSNIDIVSQYPTMRLRVRKDSLIVLFSPITEKLYGTWEFAESKETFNWTVDHNPATIIEAATGNDMTYDSLERFDIRRLTKKDLWLADKYNHVLRFVPE